MTGPTNYNFSLKNEVKRDIAREKEDKEQVVMLEPFQKFGILSFHCPFLLVQDIISLKQEENKNTM